MAIKKQGKPRMAETSRSTASFDLDKLRELVEMMDKHGVSEVNLRRGDERWMVRRGPGETINMLPPGYGQPAYSTMPTPAYQAPSLAPAPVPQTAPAVADNTITIKSPTVGTYYESPAPSDPPFVKVGYPVKPDTVVCVIEAMKVFNQIPSEVSGTITEICVANGDPVEYGQILFKVKP